MTNLIKLIQTKIIRSAVLDGGEVIRISETSKVRPVKHGTLSAYSCDRCRCQSCVSFYSTYNRSRNRRMVKGEVTYNRKSNN